MISGLKSGSNPESTAWLDEVISGEQQPEDTPIPRGEFLVRIATVLGTRIVEAREDVLGGQAVSSMAGEGPNPRLN